MNTPLKDFLAQKTPQFLAESERNKRDIAEWRVAVEGLFDRLESWLSDADPNGIILRERGTMSVTEPTLGRYEIARLDLQAFGKWIGVIPKSRRTIMLAAPRQQDTPERATGRVDITNEIRRFVLYRFGQGEGEEWWVDDPSLQSSGLQPLTAERFETVLLGYFR